MQRIVLPIPYCGFRRRQFVRCAERHANAVGNKLTDIAYEPFTRVA